MSNGGGGEDEDEEELEPIQRKGNDKLIKKIPTTIAVMLHPTNQFSITLHTNIVISNTITGKQNKQQPQPAITNICKYAHTHKKNQNCSVHWW